MNELMPLLQNVVDPVTLFLLGWILKDVRALKKELKGLEVALAKDQGKIELLWETGKDSPKMKQDINNAWTEIRKIKDQKEV